MLLHQLLFGLAAVCYTAAVQANGDASRQLAAELAVMTGDVRQLTTARIGPQERAGLNERLQGALASFPLLLRRAGERTQPVVALRAHLNRQDWRSFLATLEPLGHRHPFSVGFMSFPSTPQRIAAGKTLHKEVCASCHDSDWGDARLPAKNLSAQLVSMARVEFAARLWLGVRGTREHAYANPFTDEELAGLMAYYAQSQ